MFLRLAQEPQCIHDDALSGGRNFGERASVAHENIDAQLFLQLLELLADGRLRCVQLSCSGGEVQIVLGDRGQKAQLLKFHAGIALNQDRSAEPAARGRSAHVGRRLEPRAVGNNVGHTG